MRRLGAVLALIVLGLSLLATPAGAATGISSRLQLRGHLPDLGERPAMRVFQTQAAYDSFRTGLGEANVFPASSNMFMSFDKEILALYALGNDSGGRCLGTSANAILEGNAATLDLFFVSGTCGAPISAHYPFILVSLARIAGDGTSWVTPALSVCAAPRVADIRACASLGTSTTTPSPAPTGVASPSPTTAATVTPTAAASPTASRTAAPTTAAPTTAAPTTTVSTTPLPTRSVVAVASPTAAASPTATLTGGNNDFLITAGLVGLGVLIGIVIMAARRPRRSIRRIP